MTIEARYTLQKGLPENWITARSDYRIDDLLDSYIVQKQAIKNKLLEDNNFVQLIESELEDCIESAVEDILKNFD